MNMQVAYMLMKQANENLLVISVAFFPIFFPKVKLHSPHLDYVATLTSCICPIG